MNRDWLPAHLGTHPLRAGHLVGYTHASELMPAPKIRADYDQLTQISRLFSNEADSVNRLKQALLREVATLRGGDWVGPGAKAFYAEMDGQVMPSIVRLSSAMSLAQSVTLKILQIIRQAEGEAAEVLRKQGSISGTGFAGASAGASAHVGSGGGGFLSQVGGFFEGIWEGGKGLVTGVVHVVLHPIDTIKGIAHAVTHPGELWDALKKPYVEDWQSGNYGRAIGRGVFEVAMLLIPGVGEGKAAAKAAELAELTAQVSKASKLAEVAELANGVAKVGRAAELTEAANTLAKGAKAAEAALAVSGDTAALAKATDAFASATRGLSSPEAVASMERFAVATDKVIPDVMKEFGGSLGRPGAIPTELAGRRVTDLGRWAETSAAGNAGERILAVPDSLAGASTWSKELNSLWLREAIDNGDVIKLVTPVENNLKSLASAEAKFGNVSVYGRELDTLVGAGYKRVGDYLIPPATPVRSASIPTGVAGAAGTGGVATGIGAGRSDGNP